MEPGNGSAGHYLAAHAGFEILEVGGNAVDAGIAACITLAVVQSDFVNVGGVAPMMIYSAKSQEVAVIPGLGSWPAAASSAYFRTHHAGDIPEGVLRSVIPAAPAAWILALRRFGTLSFADIAKSAIRFAKEGFVMYPLMAEMVASAVDRYRRWPSSAAIYLPDGQPPKVGTLFIQSDLARTLQYMVDEEASNARKGRDAALAAAHDAFYRGDIANRIADYHRANGGLMTFADLAGFELHPEPALRITYRDVDIYSCDCWCQGPVLLQTLRILENFDFQDQQLNSSGYIHQLVESIKIAFADREAYYGDPRFIDVPLSGLLSQDYASSRAELLHHNKAWRELPPPGKITGYDEHDSLPSGPRGPALSRSHLDTSYVCVVDRYGNSCSATPSDISADTPVIPGTGLCVSSRGSQAWTDNLHPSSVAPGKRPRLTPNPALAIRPHDFVMPFGTPGGDVQCQAMLQVLHNILIFGMNPQEAVEAPRFASYSMPDSFWPHSIMPGRLNLESRIDETIGATLSGLGHDVAWWPEWTWKAGGVCTIRADVKNGVLSSGADPRRPSYAVGW